MPTTSSNPKFDKRMQSYPPMAFGAGLVRGFMITDEAYAGKYYRVNFLRNPSVVDMSHALDNDVNLDPAARATGNVTLPLVALKSNVGFTLLFDRTYETWGDQSSKLGSKHGVWADLLALYNLCGMTQTIADATTDDGSAGIRGDGGNLNEWITSPMVYRPTWVYFGGPMKFYGTITGLQIQITHWTIKMVPTRAQVNVSFEVFPAPVRAKDYRPWEWDSGTGHAAAQNTTSSANAAEYRNPGGRPTRAVSPYEIARTSIGRGGR